MSLDFKPGRACRAPCLSFPRSALIVIHKSAGDRHSGRDAGIQRAVRASSQGAHGTPYRGIVAAPRRRDSVVYNDERSAWECLSGRSASRHPGQAKRNRPPVLRDAERRRLHSHAERGNDGTRSAGTMGNVSSLQARTARLFIVSP